MVKKIETKLIELLYFQKSLEKRFANKVKILEQEILPKDKTERLREENEYRIAEHIHRMQQETVFLTNDLIKLLKLDLDGILEKVDKRFEYINAERDIEIKLKEEKK